MGVTAMRLIDADKMAVDESEAYMSAQVQITDDLNRLVNFAARSKIQRHIADTPTVDAVPVVHGHFVHDGPRFAHGVDWWHCSNCGRLASGVETRFDYCPWCGARM